MKVFSILICVIAAAPSFAKTHFQARLAHGAAHELTWIFPRPMPGWGKTDKGLVTLECPGTLETDHSLRWSNPQTLKLEFNENLDPGVVCTVSTSYAPRDKHTFKVPLAKISSVLPWNFEGLDEDTVFVLQTSAPVSHGRLADVSYVEVEGLSEKVELDAVGGEQRDRVIKAAYLDPDQRSVVLKPRRHFPYGKKVALIVPAGQTVAFRKEGLVREPFKATLTCERSNPEAGCSPLGEVRLNFNSPVSSEELRKISLSYGNEVFRPLGLDDASELSSIGFKLKLRPDSRGEIRIEGPLKDQDGRVLSNAKKFPLGVVIGSLPPLAKFPGAFGILEATAGPVLPVTVRNLEKVVRLKKNSARLTPRTPKTILNWLKEIRDRQSQGYELDKRSRSIFQDVKLSTQQETLDYAFEENSTAVLGLPLEGKGLHIVELTSERLAQSLLHPKAENFFTSTAILVTNLSAHLKLGAVNSLVWVTQLDSGRPVAGARVELFDCQGSPRAQGITNNEGYVTFDAPDVTEQSLRNCNQDPGDIMVLVSKDDDVTFTLAGWSEGVESWRFGVPWYDSLGSLRAHTVFDRPIYQQGEAVQMLHLLREQTSEAYRLGPKTYKHLRIVHYETLKEWILPLTWEGLATAVSTFKLDAQAPQGNYHLFLRKTASHKESEIPAGSFLVKELRVPLVVSEAQFEDMRRTFYKRELIKVFGRLEYLAGGAVSGSEVTVRGTLTPVDGIRLESHPGFTFSLNHDRRDRTPETELVGKQQIRTGADGNFMVTFAGFDKLQRYAVLNLDFEYLDPNGVYESTQLSAQVLPSKSLVGIKAPFTAFMKDPVSTTVVFVDASGKPAPGKKFRGRLLRRFTTTTRKKILGGFYAYDSQTQEEDLGQVCAGASDAQGLGSCQFRASRGGTHLLVVESEGVSGVSTTYVYGDKESWEPQTYHDRADLIPDKNEYLPGETARLEFKLPFEKCFVLVTKERQGVRSAMLQEITRANPFLEIPIDRTDAPNVFVSALAVRGRLGKGQATGTIDLSKPAFRIGLKELKVKRPDRELRVLIETNGTDFRPREKVALRIQATSIDGSPVGETSVAVSVFDEGLLQKSTSNSFEVWEHLFKYFRHEVSTATAQGHVIGKRHFGLKAKPHGGGGGAEARPRELFDALVFWDPKVKLDKNGEAKVSIALNDSLTKFRIRALAYGTEHFGHSELSIQSRQELMAFNGTAPALRAGDSARAFFTLKNISSRVMNIEADLLLGGANLAKGTHAMNPGESAIVSGNIPVREQAGENVFELKLREKGLLIDHLKFTQKIVPLQSPQVMFTDLKHLKGEVEVPKNEGSALPFGVRVSLSSSIMPGAGALQTALSEYAYQCLEQLVAKAIIYENAQELRELVARLPTYMDAQGFLKFYPSREEDTYLPLSAHLLEVFYWAKVQDPVLGKIEKALQGFIDGKLGPSSTWVKTHREKIRLRFMTTLKLRGSLRFNPLWLRDLEAPQASDDFATLLDKWILFHPGDRSTKALELIQQSFKMEGSMVTLPQNSLTTSDFLFDSRSALFGRFLLRKSAQSDVSNFEEFFKDNRGKFYRGYLSLRRRGHFGDTVANTFAYFLTQEETSAAISGITEFGPESVTWSKNQAPMIFLSTAKLEEGKKLSHRGTGTPWAHVNYLGFTDPGQEKFSGMKAWLEIRPSGADGKFKVQDRITAKLSLEIRDDLEQVGLRTFLPSGATVLDVKTELSLAHEERNELEWRGYFGWIPRGNHVVEVTFRLNQPGHFRIPGSRVEALYSPELSAETPFWEMTVHD